MVKFLSIFLLASSVLTISLAQSTGDYRTRASGNWDVVTTWQVFNGGAWRDLEDATAGIYQNVTPDNTKGAISILGHNITIPNGFSVKVDQTTISSTGSLSVSSGGTLTMVNASNSLVVNGLLAAANGSVITSFSTINISFSAGSKYQHRFTTTQGVIPRATWNATSTLEITGYTTFASATSAGNWTQTYGHVIWNCSNQAVSFSLNGLLRTVKGNFRVIDSNNQILQLSTTQHPTINVSGDFDIEGNSIVYFGTTGATTTVNISGDFNFNPTNSSTSQFCSTGTTTVNVSGDFNMDAGSATLNLANSVTSSGTGNLYIRGNFSLTSGTIKEGLDDSATSSGKISFTTTGSGITHTFTNTGTIANRINYRLISATDTLHIIGESQLIGNTGSSFTLSGGYVILESEAANGAIQTGSGVGQGNVRTATRSITAGSTYIYQGAGAQVIGNGHTSTDNIIINNADGVELNNTSATTVTIAGLTIEDGDLTVTNNNLTLSGTTATATLTGGDIIINSTSAARTFTVPYLVLNGGDLIANGDVNTLTITVSKLLNQVNGDVTISSPAALVTLNLQGDLQGTGNLYFIGDNNRINIAGSGAFSRPLPVTQPFTLSSFVVNRASITVTVPAALTVTGNVSVLNGNLTVKDLTVKGDLNVSTGCTLDFSNSILELQSQFNNISSGGVLYSTSGSTLKCTGAGSVGTLIFAAGGNSLSKLVLNRPTTGTLVTLNSTLTIYDSIRLDDGIFRNTSGLTLRPGAVFVRNSDATLSGVAPVAVGDYDLVLEGTSLTTGLEASGPLQNLTSNCTGTATINLALSLSGDLTVNSGTFSPGANTISADNFSNAGTFNAPSTTFTLTGNFIDNGVYNANNGTINFNGLTAISGTSTSIFNSIVIGGSLDPMATLEFKGNFTNNGSYVMEDDDVVRLTGTTRQDVSGTQPIDFFDVEVTNITSPYSASIEGTVNLYGVLDLAAGCQFEADGLTDAGLFTVKSTQDIPTSVGGSIAALDTSTAFFGTLTVERYMTGETGRYNRYISSPVTGATVSQITSDYSVQEVKWYNETLSGSASVGYTVVPGSTTLVSGRGYLVLPAVVNQTVTWDVSGPLTDGSNRGSVNFNITHTDYGKPSADGWNLCGNPYPANIGWGINAGWTRQNIGATITVPNLDGTDKTYTYNGTDGTGTLPNGVIAMGQAFWVYANADPTPGSPASGDEAMLIVNENAKTTADGTFYRQAGPKSKQLIITLLAPNGAQRETFLKTNERATDDFDLDFDAHQFKMEGINIALIDKNKNPLLMHTLPAVDENLNVPVDIDVAEPGEYAITFDKQSEFLGTKELFLVDDEEQVAIALNTDEPSYRFFVSDARHLVNRFRISAKPTYSLEGGATNIILFPNPVSNELKLSARGIQGGALEILDVNGRPVSTHNFTNSETTINTTTLPKGVYIVRIVSAEKVFLKKLIKE